MTSRIQPADGFRDFRIEFSLHPSGDSTVSDSELALTLTPEKILADYRLVFRSRRASLLGRRDVLNGRATFGVFGDGKELAQVALAHAWRKGDWRSGYYRDQTLMMALGEHDVAEFFAQLYGTPELDADRHHAGRGMNAHFASRNLTPDGSWRPTTDRYNSSSDVSPTGSQMPRLVGLGLASKLFRQVDALKDLTAFSHNGDEVAFGTIGNASTAEGLFWEAINAIGVLQVPVVMSIWDDEYGISVHNEHQLTKASLAEMLSGFQRRDGERGFDLYQVHAWDYPALVDTFLTATAIARRDHVPALVHVIEVTQPQGHSTSGSHERYKSEDRLAWEREMDCLPQFRRWIVESGIATEQALDAIEAEEKQAVNAAHTQAWATLTDPVCAERDELAALLDKLAQRSAHGPALQQLRSDLQAIDPLFNRKPVYETALRALLLTRSEPGPARQQLAAWRKHRLAENDERYGSHLYSRSAESPLRQSGVVPVYSAGSPNLRGYEILNRAFDAMFARDPRVVAFGEDLGFLGGVNQGFAGLQQKYGDLRVSDTGIREATIIGQAIGLAMRGLRPIAEIQYLDYLHYALQIVSDDLATVHYRTRGGQKAPVIIRTRGHRLVGIWHAGSPMLAITNLTRGMHIVVPRNMVQAAGFYNTLLDGDDPALVVEVLNGYRLRERLPDNLAEMRLPLGVPEVLREGRDLTVVTYGAMCRIALDAASRLVDLGIDTEVIDVQTLMPFDLHSVIARSLQKTSRILFADEDVPGGATAYMMQEVLERQGGYQWLDAPPRTHTATAHRPAYGTDGDYFSKPNTETLVAAIYDLMNESDPARFPTFLD